MSTEVTVNTAVVAKPISQLLDVPCDIQNAMESMVEYWDFVHELREDICNTYNHPILWAAIDRLMKHMESAVQAEVIVRSAGYTYDDALALRNYESKSPLTPSPTKAAM